MTDANTPTRACDDIDVRRDGYTTALRDVIAEMDRPAREITECEHGDDGVWGCPWCLRMNFVGWLESSEVSS